MDIKIKEYSTKLDNFIVFFFNYSKDYYAFLEDEEDGGKLAAVNRARK